MPLTKIDTKMMGSGAVLQVQYGLQQTPTTTSSGSYVATPLQAVITPTSTTSKIVIVYSCQMYSTVAGADFVTGIARNGSIIAPNIGKANFTIPYNNTFSGSYVDSPASTSALTYTLYMRSLGGHAITFNVDTYPTSIIVIEVAA